MKTNQVFLELLTHHWRISIKGRIKNDKKLSFVVLILLNKSSHFIGWQSAVLTDNRFLPSSPWSNYNKILVLSLGKIAEKHRTLDIS